MLLSNGFSTVNWLWLFSAIFIGSVPLLLQIRNYNKTGSKDYLLFAGIFLLSAYIWFIGSIRDRNIDVFTHKSIMITFYLLHFLIILHASRLRWKTSPLVIIYPSMLGLIIMEMIALFSSWDLLLQFWEVEQITGGLVHIWVGVILLYSYFTVESAIPSPRVTTVKIGFMILGILVVGQGLIESVGRFIIFEPDFSEVLIGMTTVIYSLILCLLAIFFPESMVISHIQILRAKELYEKVQEYQIKGEKDGKEDKIISYILLLNERGFVSKIEN